MIWPVLFGISIIAHAIVSWRVGQEIDDPNYATETVEVQIALAEPPPPKPIEDPPPEDALEFEEEFEVEPPDTLIAPQAVAPPPPDAPLALRAESGGMTGFDLMNPVSLLPLGKGFGTAGFGRGIGNALGNSSNQFAAYVTGLRDAGLDVVFVIDATNSMAWALDEVKSRIHDIAKSVRSLVPATRFGVVAYRDRDDPEFVVRSQPLTFSTAKLRRFLGPLEASGGGDMYEDITQGVDVAIGQSGWRAGARRVLIVIGDAPPRPGRSGGVDSTLQEFRDDGRHGVDLGYRPDGEPEPGRVEEGT